MLELRSLQGGYRPDNLILKGVTLSVNDGEAVAVLGQNGAGKSTLAKSIMHAIPIVGGSIKLDGIELSRKKTSAMSEAGIRMLMQGGQVFPQLTISENLRVAATGLKASEFNRRTKETEELIPLLRDSAKRTTDRRATYLSGGDRHQLALAMALMRQPRLLILDEPSAGLSPANTKALYEVLQHMRETISMGILLIEQNVNFALSFADRVVLLRSGVLAKEARVEQLKAFQDLDSFYFQ